MSPRDDDARNDRLAEAAENKVSSVAQFDFQGGLPPSRPVGVGTGSGGGDMEDVLRRWGSPEKDVSEIRINVAGIAAQLPHVATKEDVAQLPYVATKADVMATRTEIMATKTEIMAVRVEVSDAKTSIIQWVVATTIAMAALAFTIAKFVH